MRPVPRIFVFLKQLGPGVITGASDDDPSGILTYLQSGAVLGFRALWTALFTVPLMYGIQEMCGRIGAATGKGITQLIRERFSPAAGIGVAVLSAIVITVNIGADLLAIGVVLEQLFGGNRLAWISGVALLVFLATVLLSYRRFASALKWLTLSLLCYVIAVFYLRVDFLQALRATFIPSFSTSPEGILLITAILGTTISPYLFFWQANEEAEERGESARAAPDHRFHATAKRFALLRSDTLTGMIFSNVVTWFIIAGASGLASAYGVHAITNFQQAALVLRPFLGEFAYLAFSAGIIGAGLLAMPVLAGSIGYMFAETFRKSEGINKKFGEARGFYLAIGAAILGGLAINLFGFDPVQLLVYTAVFYTLITPPIILLILRVANDREIMRHRVNSPLSNALGWATFGVMSLAAIAYLVSLLPHA